MKLQVNRISLKSYDAPLNMAIDEILFSLSVKHSISFLRFYGWKLPAISFGYFQRPSKKHLKDLPFVRRLTGGGIVKHEKDLTFCLSGPAIKPLENSACVYQFLSRVLMKTLLKHFPDKTLTLSSYKASSKKLYDCFDTPVAADILFNKKKIYGGAIRKRKNFFLFQGTLQGKVIEDNRKEIIKGIISKMENLFEFREFDIPQLIMKQAKKLAKEKYLNDEWNYKSSVEL